MGEKMARHKTLDSGLLAPLAEVKRRGMKAIQLGILLKIADRGAGFMDEDIDSLRVFKERPEDGRVSGEDDLLVSLLQVKVVGQRRDVVRDSKCPQGQAAIQAHFSTGPNGPEANPHPDFLLAESKKVQKATGEGDRLVGAQNPHFSVLEHQAMDEGRQTINVVRMDMSEEDRRNSAGIEGELSEFGHSAPGAIDEHKPAARAEKNGGVISLRSRHPPSGAQKINLGHFFEEPY